MKRDEIYSKLRHDFLLLHAHCVPFGNKFVLKYLHSAADFFICPSNSSIVNTIERRSIEL